MSLLESEVVSVLETLVKATVKEMTKFVDISGIPPLTETNVTANKSATPDFAVSEQKVYEISEFLLVAFVFKPYTITCMI